MNAAKRHWKVIAIAVVSFTVGGALAASGSSSGSTVKRVAGPTRTVTNNVPGPTVTQPAVTVTKTTVKVVHAKPKPKAQPTSTGSPTVSQQNAVRSAQDYLQTQAFSQKGLIGQLKYEGFSTADATYAVSAFYVNWSDQAAKDAKDYLQSQAFSRSGLIGQLEYDGFTAAQATFGVNKVGL
jgi:Host cell surface-exposed lipoprotein